MLAILRNKMKGRSHLKPPNQSYWIGYPAIWNRDRQITWPVAEVQRFTRMYDTANLIAGRSTYVTTRDDPGRPTTMPSGPTEGGSRAGSAGCPVPPPGLLAGPHLPVRGPLRRPARARSPASGLPPPRPLAC